MNTHTRAALLLFAAAYMMLFALRLHMLAASESRETLRVFVDTKHIVEGVVVNDPDRRDTSLHANIRVSAVDGSAANGTLLALFDRNASVAYEDRVEIQGRLVLPQAFETDTGHVFDYPNYLRVQGVSVVMQKAELVNATSGGWSLQGSLFDLKHWFERSLEELFPEPDNSLLEGILLGERRGIPKDLNNAFVTSGLVHVVALSGYNLSIIAVAIFKALAFLPQAATLPLGGGIMILFTLMTGAGATTVRALVMAVISLIARYRGRSVLALRSLLVAALGMALWNPLVVLYDPSFILSVLATFGLITLVPTVEYYLPAFFARYALLREIMASTIAVQLFVLPALLYFTGVVSLLSVPANILALPAVPLAMLGGFIAGVASSIHPMLAFAPMVLADALLKWILFVANSAAAIPFGSAVIPQFAAWIVIVAYVPLTFLALLAYNRFGKDATR